jgi:sulfite exporter TauE/SafE
MEPQIAGLAGALALGLTGSLHCFAMCGPLACSALPLEKGPGRTKALVAYHGARSVLYAGQGALAGLVGHSVARLASIDLRAFAAWGMALMLVATALDWTSRLPIPGGLRRLATSVVRAGARWPAVARAATFEAGTSLLPCGLLYGALAVAALTGSALSGSASMLVFSLGAIPALLASQMFGPWLALRPSTRWMRRLVPLLAAVLVVARSFAMSASGGHRTTTSIRSRTCCASTACGTCRWCVVRSSSGW